MRALRLSCAGVSGALVVWFLLMRRGTLPLQPQAFASAVALLMALAVAWFGAGVVGSWRHRPVRAARLCELLVAAGLLTALGGGMANWLLGLQGSVILLEGEKRFLSQPSQLDAFDAGPLARRLDLGGLLELLEVDLVPGGEGFVAESRLSFVRAHGQEPSPLVLSTRRGGSVGPIRFSQGAFGFAPRLVLLKGDQTLFDREVPFETQSVGRRVLTFEGECRIEAEGMDLAGAISLEGLDADMKGHPLLGIEVRRGGKLLGRGELLPGHFADLEEGYRIGFAGLKRWAEIDISRKNYPLPIFIGFGMMALGSLLWPLAVWRKW